MQFGDILARFGETSAESDGGYLARCPAHADSRPSLRIWRGDDHKARITCRAGCAPDAVIAAAGLTWPDMFNVSGVGATVPKERPALVSGQHAEQLQAYTLRASVRFQDAAAYAWRRFGISHEQAHELGLGVDDGGDDEFEYRSSSFTRFPRLTVPLYDFEGVARGLQGRDLSGKCPGRWVSLRNPEGCRWAAYGVFRGHGGYGATLITEGPGDALSAVSVGYDSVAVRGASLAGSPELLAELGDGLRGTQVVVCGDADSAGQGFAQRLAHGLAAYGIDVYTLSLPAGVGDLTEWREGAPEAFASALHSAVRSARLSSVSAVTNATAELSQRTGAEIISSSQGEDAARVLAELVSRYGESDAMNAHALVAWTDGRIRYAPGLGFYIWNGRFWECSQVKVRQEVHKMGAALVLAGKLHESRGFTMTTRIDNLLTELRSVPSVYVTPDDFDCQRHLLSFRNGTVDLRSGELRPHDKQDMITYCLGIDYSADAQCPRWDQFLAEVFVKHPELVDFIQRLTGYGITGSTDEQCFAVLWGKGANGKSVYTDTLSSVFSAITNTTPFATFEEKPAGSIPNDLAAMRGARLVMASEGNAGRRMDEAALKKITGKDKVSARFLHKELFTYTPTYLIMLATNHKPNFVSQDEGLWRRIKLIPFDRWFAPHERDYDLDRKLMAEAEGITTWAVRGAVEWYKRGLADPPVITSQTREYRETSDVLSGFFPGVIEFAEGETLHGNEAYISYTGWCEEEGLSGRDVKSRTLFYRLMEERGVPKRKIAKGIVLDGVRLADPHKIDGPGIFGH